MRAISTYQNLRVSLGKRSVKNKKKNGFHTSLCHGLKCGLKCSCSAFRGVTTEIVNNCVHFVFENGHKMDWEEIKTAHLKRMMD